MRALGENADASSTLWGKLAYLAPEQLERLPLTPQVDLWGAATVLYECFTNQRAIQGASSELLQEALRSGTITPPEKHRPDLPAGLSEVVARGLARDPKKRYQTAAEFSAALAPFHDEISGGALGIASVVRGLFR